MPTWLIDLNIYASLLAMFAYVYITVTNIDLGRWAWALLSLSLSIVAGFFAYAYIQIALAPDTAAFIESVWVRTFIWLAMIGPAAAWGYQAKQLSDEEQQLCDKMLEAKQGAEKLRDKIYHI